MPSGSENGTCGHKLFQPSSLWSRPTLWEEREEWTLHHQVVVHHPWPRFSAFRFCCFSGFSPQNWRAKHRGNQGKTSFCALYPMGFKGITQLFAQKVPACKGQHCQASIVELLEEYQKQPQVPPTIDNPWIHNQFKLTPTHN